MPRGLLCDVSGVVDGGGVGGGWGLARRGKCINTASCLSCMNSERSGRATLSERASLLGGRCSCSCEHGMYLMLELFAMETVGGFRGMICDFVICFDSGPIPFAVRRSMVSVYPLPLCISQWGFVHDVLSDASPCPGHCHLRWRGITGGEERCAVPSCDTDIGRVWKREGCWGGWIVLL